GVERRGVCRQARPRTHGALELPDQRVPRRRHALPVGLVRAPLCRAGGEMGDRGAAGEPDRLRPEPAQPPYRAMTDITTATLRCAGGLPAFLAVPKREGELPAIVLMHERYGLVKHTCDLAARLARDGFVCIAPDFFYKHPDQDALHRGDVGY